MNVERLAPFFRAFRSGLTELAERSQPRICLLTPGPYSETYFEQAYLARYLGFLLVEGDDLVVRDGVIHVRTIAGLKRADVMWRRVDADYVDPLELNGASRLGVPRPALDHSRRRSRRRQHAGYRLHRVARADELHAAHLPSLHRRRSPDAQHRDLVVRPGAGARRGAGESGNAVDRRRVRRARTRLRAPGHPRAREAVERQCRKAAGRDRLARHRLCRPGAGASLDDTGVARRQVRAASVRAARLRRVDPGRLARDARRLLPDIG